MLHAPDRANLRRNARMIATQHSEFAGYCSDEAGGRNADVRSDGDVTAREREERRGPCTRHSGPRVTTFTLNSPSVL
jgi:hypothetical protein